MTPDDRIVHLEARLEALNATLANVLSTFVLHGLLTKASVDQLLAEAAAHAPGPVGASQVEALKAAYPAAIREAMGPEPDEGDHDH
jgi:hypothetical protein